METNDDRAVTAVCHQHYRVCVGLVTISGFRATAIGPRRASDRNGRRETPNLIKPGLCTHAHTQAHTDRPHTQPLLIRSPTRARARSSASLGPTAAVAAAAASHSKLVVRNRSGTGAAELRLFVRVCVYHHHGRRPTTTPLFDARAHSEIMMR